MIHKQRRGIQEFSNTSTTGQVIWTKYFTELYNDESRQINDKEKYKVVMQTNTNKL